MAQANPLIGVWSASSYDRNGATQTVLLQFFPSGALLMKGVKRGLAQDQPIQETGWYRLLSGSSVQVMFTDYEPKQCAQIPTVVPGAPTMACEPPPFTINQPIVRGFEIREPGYLIFSDGATYVHQPAMP